MTLFLFFPVQYIDTPFKMGSSSEIFGNYYDKWLSFFFRHAIMIENKIDH